MRELLRVEHVVKTFPGLTALDDVSLTVDSGEILAVIGHNGSGKSTLVKILAGVHDMDAGQVTLSAGAGLHFIHQDLALVGELSAVENLNLVKTAGLASLGANDARAQRRRAMDLISQFGEAFDVDVPVQDLTAAQRAIVAIARALDGWTRPQHVIVLDEPTESLTRAEVEILFAAIRRLAADGAGVVFISHRLDEVLELATRVIVLRDGRKVADEAVTGLDHDRLVELITCTSAAALAEAREPGALGDAALTVRGLKGANIASLGLDLRRGEIVGIAGVLGSGREAVPALLFGAVPGSADAFVLDGAAYDRRSPAASIRRGIAYVPGDRARFGSVRALSARENMTLPSMRRHTNAIGAIRGRLERAEADRLMAAYRVRPARGEQAFGSFSGGNQQKIVFAKWLRNRPSLLLLEEPTQGVDIGAKQAIYDAIGQAARDGAAVLVSSSDAKELLRVCHRVVVLRGGRAVADLTGADLTEHQLLRAGYGLGEVGGAA